MKSVIMMAALLLLTGCGHTLFHNWSRDDKILFATSTGLLTVDAFQTRYILKSDDFTEKNPVLKKLGPGGVFPYFAVCIIGTYIVADFLEEDNRTNFLNIVNAIEFFTVGNNVRIGVKF